MMPLSIAALSPISSTLPMPGTVAPKPAGLDFGTALKDAVGTLGQLGAKADASSLALAKGDPIDIHEVMLNNEQASIGFSMALQVPNKLTDAYQEDVRVR